MKILGRFQVGHKKRYSLKNEKNSNSKQSIIEQPVSQEDIIYLQKICMENGFHYLQSEGEQENHFLINKILTSLHYYHDIAFLSLNTSKIKNNFFDIYNFILKNGYLENQYYDIEAFMLEEFYADFLWIEENRLKDCPWYMHFLEILKTLKYDRNMPIVIFK